MAATRDQRVDDALQQLVSRLVPPNPNEDEVLDDQRWNEAIQLARNHIGESLGKRAPRNNLVEKEQLEILAKTNSRFRTLAFSR